MSVPESILVFVSVYFAAGVLFAIVFVAIGAGRIDSQTHQAGIGFRLIILPGASLLWPLLLERWLREGGPK
jgi:hypothetical protein